MSSGSIGENFVLCELMRNKMCGLLSPDSTNKCWDLVAFDAESNVGVKLQVKTVTWPKVGSKTKATLTGNFSGNFDFLVVVVLDYSTTTPYLVYVVAKSEIVGSDGGVGGIPTKNGDKFKFTNKSIPFSTYSKHKKYIDEHFGEKWNSIKELLRKRSGEMHKSSYACGQSNLDIE